ncbi:MAG: hypothetical protein HKP30_04640 [Myxococcales bacterium]|nr:hypothetical protein [Myxococcales bacterium]
MLNRFRFPVLFVSALAVLMLAAPAKAVPIADVLAGTDGNFLFSVVHTSTGGSDGQSGTVLGDVSLSAAGGSFNQGVTQAFFDAELDVDIGGSISTYQAKGAFDLAGLLDFSAQSDVLLGYLDFTLLAGADDAGIADLTFYFEDRNYSTATNPPNGLSGDLLTLWGATEFNGTPTIGAPFDLVAGGRGIDLRVKLAPPIPEPGSRPLYLAGLAIVALGAARMRRQG